MTFAAAKAAAAERAAPFTGRRWGREAPAADATPSHDAPAPGATAVASRPVLARKAYDGDDVSTIKEVVWQPPVVPAVVPAVVGAQLALALLALRGRGLAQRRRGVHAQRHGQPMRHAVRGDGAWSGVGLGLGLGLGG